MGELLTQGLREGAVGMSSGLTYPPGMFASDEELVTLCRVVGEHGGYYCRTTGPTGPAPSRPTPR